MKKLLLSLTILFSFYQQSDACTYYDPDTEYFNLFAQETISNQAYYPFLLSYSNPFYERNEKIQLADENIEAWQKYFRNELSYSETDALLKTIDIKHLYNIKKGKLTHQLFKKLGVSFYKRYKEGLDYIIEAKYLQPYMRIKSSENYSFYHDEKTKNATEINYARNNKALISLYNAAKNPIIKLRYGYQLVRFNHYTGHYQKAINYFQQYVKPLRRDTPIYWYALDQMAGAERGLGMNDKANYHFFQVFMHSRNRKASAYTSMKLSNNGDFKKLLKQAKNKEEQNFVYFLLAYNSFNREVPAMENILANDPQSDLTKVLAARAINELERSYLPYQASCDNEDCKNQNERLPFYHKIYDPYSGDIKENNYTKALEKFIIKAKNKSNDDFWKISLAYLQFLQGKHQESDALLSEIPTKSKLYQSQIKRIQLLNDIVSQPKITAEFENKMLKKYPKIFEFKKNNKNYWNYPTGTKGFIHDILANRYFLQGEHGKSFLMNNHLSALQYSPNSHLVKHVEAFFNKKGKTNLENKIATKSRDIGDIQSFFALIHGDFSMRNAEFQKAKKFYQKATQFAGIYRTDWDNKKITYENETYNGFSGVSNLVFGHQTMVSYSSSEDNVMKSDYLNNFPFIKKKMNKLELANAVLKLQKIGKKKNELGSKANQLIGNLLYNTSILGYYRHYFVMDINNENGIKFHFTNHEKTPYHFYYKNFGFESSIDQNNFDLAIDYYQKALNKSKNREQKASILFQMASAEQGKFYQWEAQLPNIKWDKDWKENEKNRNQLTNNKKNVAFRTYFGKLKSDYADTETAKNLMGSCSYFKYFMK